MKRKRDFMKSSFFLILWGCFLLALPSFAQQGPFLAAVVPADDAVNLYRVNGAQLQLHKSIPIPGPVVAMSPPQMCVDPAGSTLFVGSAGKHVVVAIDLKSQTVAGTFDNVPWADGCVVSPDGNKLYVADREANVVWVFATGSRKVIHKIHVADEPRRGIFLPNGKLVFSSGEGDSLNVIDPGSDEVVRTVKADVDPPSMVVTTDHQRLVVANTSADALTYYNPDTLEVTATFGVNGSSPQALLISSDGKFLYALSVSDKLIAVVPLQSVHPGRVYGTIPLGVQPVAMAAPPSAQYIFLSLKDGTLAVMDPATKAVTAIPDAKGGGALIYLP